nr:MAG TPA: hypothetical protein [Caudoviricetes sp.]
MAHEECDPVVRTYFMLVSPTFAQRAVIISV